MLPAAGLRHRYLSAHDAHGGRGREAAAALGQGMPTCPPDKPRGGRGTDQSTTGQSCLGPLHTDGGRAVGPPAPDSRTQRVTWGLVGKADSRETRKCSRKAGRGRRRPPEPPATRRNVLHARPQECLQHIERFCRWGHSHG